MSAAAGAVTDWTLCQWHNCRWLDRCTFHLFNRKTILLSNMSASECSFIELIRGYFDVGRKYEVILVMLSTYHTITMGMRTLKTCLKEAGLFRRKQYSPQAEVRRAILSELRGPGWLWGYRTMWQVLQQKHKLRGKRDVVIRLLRQLHPQGTDLRRCRRFTRRTYHSMGPNYVWYIDGNPLAWPYQEV